MNVLCAYKVVVVLENVWVICFAAIVSGLDKVLGAVFLCAFGPDVMLLCSATP